MLSAFIFLVIFLPLIISFARGLNTDTNAFVYNNGATRLLPTLGSVICGNIGIGTFLAIYLFTKASPVLGMAIVIAYTIGLLLCALFARKIFEISQKTGTYSLVDLIAVRHGNKNVILIWLPVAFVFILRSAVQLTALAVIFGEMLNLDLSVALLLSALVSASYTVLGGYKAATETDLLQAAVIVVLVIIAMFGVSEFEIEQRAFFDFGPYKPFLLIGIALFVPFSPILAVDNWQRMATSRNVKTARNGYLLAAAICGSIYLSIWVVGMLPSPSNDVLQVYRTLMPSAMPWLADLLFITAILSSIDTFVMPLISTVARKGRSLAQLRMAVVALFAAVTLLSFLASDLLNSIIAAFNSLTVFLPSVLGAFLLKTPSKVAALVSLNGGICVTIGMTIIDINTAAIVGFAFSAVTYVYLSRQNLQMDGKAVFN